MARHPSPAQSIHLPMSQTRRLRESVASRRLQNHVARPRVVDAMARRHVDGLDSLPGPQDGSDDFAPLQQGCPVSSSATGLNGLPDQSRFRAPHSRDVPENPQMRGQTEAPGVGDPLRIEDDEIGACPELPEGPIEHGTLAKRQETRHVREEVLPHRRGGLEAVQPRPRQHHHRRENAPRSPLYGDVTSRDPPETAGAFGEPHPLPEAFLERTGLFNRGRPRILQLLSFRPLR